MYPGYLEEDIHVPWSLSPNGKTAFDNRRKRFDAPLACFSIIQDDDFMIKLPEAYKIS